MSCMPPWSGFPAPLRSKPCPLPLHRTTIPPLPSSSRRFLYPCVPSTCHQTTPLPVFCPRLSASLSRPNLTVFSNLPTSHSPKALYLFCTSARYPTPSVLPLWRVHSSGYCHPGASVFSLGRMRKSIIFPTLFHGCFSCRLPSRIGHNE